MNYLFASTNFGTEKLLEKELLDLGVRNLNVKYGGIYYEANDALLYESLIWSRIASRIFLCIKTFRIKNVKDLYQNIYNIYWHKIFHLNNTFIINFKGTNHIIRSSLFGALIVKDAIVDQFKEKYSFRPNVNLINPDIRIKVLMTNVNMINVMLDLSGEALHKRGYRKFCNLTPIKENLGAAIILNSEWNKNTPMIDPMCGSGTLLIEAAMIFYDKAPGLTRKKWGFKFWKKYNKTLWENIVNVAEKRFEKGLKKDSANYFIGYDNNANIINKAKENAFNAGFAGIIKFFKKNISDLRNIHDKKNTGILLSNLPYGQREKTESQLVALYLQLGVTSKKYFKNWQLSVLSSSCFLLNFLQMQTQKEYFLKNGTLNCIQKNYQIFLEHVVIENHEYQNRLAKNFQKLKKWAQKENIECFRVYNADLPNYKIIVDVYQKWIIIQEYKAPKIINCKKSHKRLCDAIYYTKEILSIDINNIILKTRQKNKNKTQYQKLFDKKNFIEIKEFHAKFLVNLTDYLDTGLFLEKRLIRKLIGIMSKDKDFLNLFSYTGTATVYAGLGQAKSTTSVDISNTYIKWAIKNMSINNLTHFKHNFIVTDCLKWIKKTEKTFDLIFINPPTFSNSKKMNKSFELKKDYFDVINNVRKILRKNGSIIFSSSTHNFKINLDELNKIKLYAKNITKKVTCKDYINNSKVYHSWIIKHI
ncbi:23S rRNA methyltransferase [Buchnera aphidicola (Diuraphis noxia)]|uniref:Ribosomal RNA large subunit methyltransferase K/L n=1 Tax=Buchnera aphidicola subsp. Diuraphis noxia TaxID=118101 RepID=A0A1B2H8X4_BUCDN|nr:bifunctional 23S rRNA (guanine(2069)-N(7))-methyltransferase RlmK/23S rRNA (guanine(2445)-N(2))-methyltransferase RlmL [Buchnera aphidicola]ANZ22568.1 23S rRNA methyltransferase [Buchnera aphidicola (Diuraphis noxia)]